MTCSVWRSSCLWMLAELIKSINASSRFHLHASSIVSPVRHRSWLSLLKQFRWILIQCWLQSVLLGRLGGRRARTGKPASVASSLSIKIMSTIEAALSRNLNGSRRNP
ncbi:uncharacterized protein PGTG_05175 [Puccinia graminis f. sp. tritici CRL 75-36-700-3]|uniref:Uncharacterized protein n=1 Tax=Puccinia graminis f. sp. tritici (strain CRL 75-36-700-3 / race SCCL) TaxID=418459 RepID=E3K6X6_PUCGT|nr:uncharacterized protein PGTG_05175 [Puccinia graminis f. sp. tritici CRL 75-36-700-3]EFP79950.2 hypothetical protein PGTG_05175 [Puccinia graminis f. sp. tritici CRL 75-36-700-3]